MSSRRWARTHGWNDTYTFTKWIGEQLLLRDRGEVSLVIFRPAIIESSYEEPAPGWIDGLRMADPLVVAYGRGKLREFPASPHIALDLIPVDFVANGMIVALPVEQENRESVPVYHCASSDRHPLVLSEMTLAVERALLSELTVDPDLKPTNGKNVLINDPCCGTGRMLLDAGKINPEAELVGQDIDARCAKITAINLGLRNRYGWVICGNSLTGDTQFAYRIGSFFHESPNGLRRGVIRDVPPEETPIPFIKRRTQQESHDLFAQGEEGTGTVGQSGIPTIIEVPRWLARMEPKLTESNHDEAAIVEEE